MRSTSKRMILTKQISDFTMRPNIVAVQELTAHRICADWR